MADLKLTKKDGWHEIGVPREVVADLWRAGEMGLLNEEEAKDLVASLSTTIAHHHIRSIHIHAEPGGMGDYVRVWIKLEPGMPFVWIPSR